uniref:Uncharacterized protein n=1 Tax=Sphaerodactylus townsendi TaxID=933632 RepID=A0ACB8F840_9SAUR
MFLQEAATELTMVLQEVDIGARLHEAIGDDALLQDPDVRIDSPPEQLGGDGSDKEDFLCSPIRPPQSKRSKEEDCRDGLALPERGNDSIDSDIESIVTRDEGREEEEEGSDTLFRIEPFPDSNDEREGEGLKDKQGSEKKGRYDSRNDTPTTTSRMMQSEETIQREDQMEKKQVSDCSVKGILSGSECGGKGDTQRVNVHYNKTFPSAYKKLVANHDRPNARPKRDETQSQEFPAAEDSGGAPPMEGQQKEEEWRDTLMKRGKKSTTVRETVRKGVYTTVDLGREIFHLARFGERFGEEMEIITAGPSVTIRRRDALAPSTPKRQSLFLKVDYWTSVCKDLTNEELDRHIHEVHPKSVGS